MVKAFTLLLALLIGLSFSGMTFAKSLGSPNDQITIQSGDTKGDTKDGEKKDAPKMDGDKDKDKEGEKDKH